MSDSATATPELTAEQVQGLMRQRRYVGLLILAAVVGIVVSLAAWCFLELTHQLQQELFTHLPRALGYSNGPPAWWLILVLAGGGVITGFAIARLPGRGGHVPAGGLATGGAPPTGPELGGVMLAAIATLGFGLILGPEAPLIALGAGLGALTVQQIRKGMPSQVLMIMAATGSFAAVSLIFGSPLIAAVILIEATGIGGARLPLIVVPGLLGAGIGSLISTGLGSFTGLSTSAYALGALHLPDLARPDIAEFGWTIALGIVVAVLTQVAVQVGRSSSRVQAPRMLLLPVVGIVVAGLAIAFTHTAHKGVSEVLFSGQDQLPGLIAQAGTWSLSALALLIVFKGIGFSLCLGTFRGGPTFPALFLGAAGGIMASHLAGFPITAAVAVGMSAATVSVLRLPLSAVAVGTLLTSKSGFGDEPLIILGVVVAYLVTLVASAAWEQREQRGTSRPERPLDQPAPVLTGG